MQDFTNLRIWRRARDLAQRLRVEPLARSSRRNPDMATRLHKVSSAIEAHIAAGAVQRDRGQFARSLGAAQGCVSDTLRLLGMAARDGQLSPERFIMLEVELQELRRMILVFRLRVVAQAKAAPGGRSNLSLDGTSRGAREVDQRQIRLVDHRARGHPDI